jgi:chemotaxis protein methyltransferase CheR
MRPLPRTEHLERFKRVVAARLGLHFDDAKRDVVGGTLARLLDANGLTPHVYLKRLEQSPSREDVAALARALTIGETYFFRNIDQFNACAQVVFPERMRSRGAGRRLRLLSAGCASGEEAFSLAIIARNTILDPSWDVSIRAVDVNPDALEKASSGRFTQWALRETPLEIQRSYFRQQGREMVLDESILAAVTFEQRNLAHDDPELWCPETYDVVFCRNLLMYFTPEHAQSAVNRITRSLAPGGYLFLGHAETLRGLSQAFHLCHTHGTFYYQRTAAAHPAIAAGVSASGYTLAPPSSTTLDVVDDVTGWLTEIQAAAQRVRALSTRTAVAAPAAVAPRARPDLTPALDLLREERFSEALDVVDRLFPGAEQDPDVLLLQALLLVHSQRLTGAEDACRRLLAVDDLNAGAHYVLALCREGAGDRVGAAEHDQRAAYLDPLFAMPRLHLGLLARRAGDGDTARRELRQAMLLLQREDPSRLLFFGGGFSRDTLIALCRAELAASGGGP